MSASAEENSRCEKCGIEFRCGVAAGEESCWCMAFPPLLKVPEKGTSAAGGCYCPQCLGLVLASVAT